MIPFVLLQTQQSLPFLCSRKCFCIPALRNLLLWARVYFSRLYSPLGQEPHLIYYPICYTSCTQLSSVAQSCPTLCDPMDRSMPGLPVHHRLPELAQTHVHLVSYSPWGCKRVSHDLATNNHNNNLYICIICIPAYVW